jgi:hypothetical protein
MTVVAESIGIKKSVWRSKKVYRAWGFRRSGISKIEKRQRDESHPLNDDTVHNA